MRRLLFLSLTLMAAASAFAEDLAVVSGGKYRDPVNAYKIGSQYFLAAKEAGGLYGGQVYWYPVSGRLQFSVRGRSLQLQVGGDRVQVGSDMVKLDSAVMLRTSQAFVPLSFFETEAFSEWAGFETTFNPRTKLLTIDKKSSIGEMRWFSYKDYTRLSLEASPRVQHSASARGLGGVEVSFPMGTLAASEQAEIDDDVVKFYSLTQQAKAAKLAVKFAKPGLNWKVKRLKSPDRVVIDIFRGSVVDTPDEAQASAPLAEAPVEEPKAPKSEDSTEAVKPAPPIRSKGPQISAKSERRRRRIVVDAGHGGKDPGAKGSRGTLEKDINLKAALELAKLLKEEGTFEVMLTRSDDTFVPLSDRSRLANEFGADLFISLHCNAAANPKKHGFEVYFLSEKATDPAAQELADFENSVVELEGKTGEDVQAEMLLMEMSKTENINAASELASLTAKALSKRVDLENNGVKQAGFYVLRGTHAPAILFEMAFISNRRDEAKLESKKARRKVIDGVYAGIIDFAKRQGWMTSGGKS